MFECMIRSRSTRSARCPFAVSSLPPPPLIEFLVFKFWAPEFLPSNFEIPCFYFPNNDMES